MARTVWVQRDEAGNEIARGYRCPGCRKLKPASAFGKHRGKSSGLNARCKDCKNADQRRWRADHRDLEEARNARRRLPVPASRQCATCGESFAPRRRNHIRCDECRQRRKGKAR